MLLTSSATSANAQMHSGASLPRAVLRVMPSKRILAIAIPFFSENKNRLLNAATWRH